MCKQGMRAMWIAMLVVWCVALPMPALASDEEKVDPRVAPFVHHDTLDDLKLSPDGKHVAATLRREKFIGVVVFETDTAKRTGSLRFPPGNQVIDIVWANNERIVIEMGQNFDGDDKPTPTGELYGMNVDGSRQGLLAGYRVSGPAVGTRIGSRAKEEDALVFPLARIPGNDQEILVTVWPFQQKQPDARVDRLNIYTGKRSVHVTSPVREARFVADNQGRVRFAMATDENNNSRLYHRSPAGGDWQLINDEKTTRLREYPMGFSADDRIAYLQAEQAAGPDVVVAYDTGTGQRKVVARDAVLDPVAVLRDGAHEVIGVRFPAPASRVEYFEPASSAAVLHAKLQRSFPDNTLVIASASSDGNRKLLYVHSDRDPGTYYLFDAVKSSADFYLATQKRVDPNDMSGMRAYSFKARDGMELHGFLTMPAKAKGKVPMVVVPHGGPFGVVDRWGFDNDVQLLAASGYAVLQVNFRGSGGYGRMYQRAGAREWGGKMQDDVTDATKWALQNAEVDPSRVCIYGASYGGYAALMGAAKEPDLYRCAVGYVGVYDLPLLVKTDWTASAGTKTWFKDWVGDDSARLASTSPNNLAERIKAPVLIAWGGSDDIAPSKQSKTMVGALRRAGKQVETLYFPNESHGFYKSEHQAEFYQRLLDFLDKNIGKNTAH